MSNFCSSVMQPVKFFEDLIFDGGYDEFRNDFFKEWGNEKFEFFVNIYKDDDYIVHDFQSIINDSKDEYRDNNPATDQNRKPATHINLYDEVCTTKDINDWKSQHHSIEEDTRKRVNLKDVLNYRLNKEFILSQRLISQAISEIIFKVNTADNFLNHQLIILQNLSVSESHLFIEYPESKSHLLSLINFIKKLSSNRSFQEISKSHPQDHKTALIHEIFDFWKGTAGLNNKGSQIMDSAEHERLISLITEMVFSERSPVITRKFGRLPIPKALITYCFYVLKDNLYSRQRGKGYFIEFLNNAFADLADYEEKTLIRKFATQPMNEKWFPKIIQEAIIGK